MSRWRLLPGCTSFLAMSEAVSYAITNLGDLGVGSGSGMKKILRCFVICLFLQFFCSDKLFAQLFNDGESHDIDYYLNKGITVKNSPLSIPTRVNLLDNGTVEGDILIYDDSEVCVYGGILNGKLYPDYGSDVKIFGGCLNNIVKSWGDSTVSICGGVINSDIFALIHSNMVISGGYVGGTIYSGYSKFFDPWDGFDESLITFKGSNFAINGTLVDYGDYATEYLTRQSIYTPYSGSYYGHYIYYYTGSLTGTLANGDNLENTIYIYDGSNITFTIPEPATLGFLALGVVAMLRRKSVR
jgi:hypothetical protein